MSSLGPHACKVQSLPTQLSVLGPKHYFDQVPCFDLEINSSAKECQLPAEQEMLRSDPEGRI